ncbi:hypothetical protein BCR44DRAFT_338911 [Catenaria anguillulae PL171]|uniref:Uncharacterized protein n=1 Tax=Catenaria anguillulae PL171 TaxID=765915 RepID=A0A1Y2I3U9_9FUNG|nr:hypothetical protein BCR44DRAFT_338911 [Catenaria anguillulae PL171]
MHAFADCGFARGVISCRPHSRSSFFFPKRAVPLNQTFESPPRAPLTPNPQEPPRSHKYISPPHSPSQRVIRFLNSNRRTSRHILKPISPAIHNRLAVYHPPLPTTYLQQNHLACPLHNGSQLVSCLRKAHFPRRILLRGSFLAPSCPSSHALITASHTSFLPSQPCSSAVESTLPAPSARRMPRPPPRPRARRIPMCPLCTCRRSLRQIPRRRSRAHQSRPPHRSILRASHPSPWRQIPLCQARECPHAWAQITQAAPAAPHRSRSQSSRSDPPPFPWCTTRP